VRDGIDEEIAAATKDTKRKPGRSSTSSSSSTAANAKTATPAKYSRFEAEVRRYLTWDSFMNAMSFQISWPYLLNGFSPSNQILVT
jgi:hypothetical protein